MKGFLNLRILGLSSLLLLASLPVGATERPFALNGNGQANFVTDGSGNIIGANVTASGTATHLGLWTTVGTLQFRPDPDHPGVILAEGQGTITAANGYQIMYVLENSALNVTTGAASGNFRFVSGTGRFAGVSGGPTYVVSQNLATGAFELTAVGRIDF